VPSPIFWGRGTRGRKVKMLCNIMSKQAGIQNSNVRCNSLLFAHTHSSCSLVIKYFRRGCYVPPRLLRPVTSSPSAAASYVRNISGAYFFLGGANVQSRGRLTAVEFVVTGGRPQTKYHRAVSPLCRHCRCTDLDLYHSPLECFI